MPLLSLLYSLAAPFALAPPHLGSISALRACRLDEIWIQSADLPTRRLPESGWSVLQVSPFGAPHTRVSVIVHQAKVFAGATMEFEGGWHQHPRYGEQLDATRAVERKPASVAALEKYLGSGLIRRAGMVRPENSATVRQTPRHVHAHAMRRKDPFKAWPARKF